MLIDLAGEFGKMNPAKIDRFIGYAVTLLGADAASTFGDKLGLAVVYLAAHMLAVDKRGQLGYHGAGRVTSQSKDAVGFAPQLLNVAESDEALRATAYGMQFLSIRNSLAATLPRVITPGTG
jgi:hypothetical protein